MANPDPSISAVILAGGVGSRFWPASTPARPKQLLALASSRPLIVDTVNRALHLVPPDRLHLLTGSHLREAFERVLPPLPEGAFWIEPRARGTGPVLAWAAHRLVRHDPSAIMVSLHADHSIAPTGAMVRLLEDAAELAAERGLLLTVAIPPTRPETGYGWIRPGSALSDREGLRAWEVGAFVEKPDVETARRYLDEGYLWNSGIFVWSAGAFLDEVRRVSPEIGPHLPLLDQGKDEAFFDAVTPISVDEAVLERSERVGTVEATFQWDDVGSWASLARSGEPDGAGNTTRGPVHPVDARGNLVWAEDGPVVLWGVDDLVVIRSAGISVIAPRDRSPDWKTLLDALPGDLRKAVDRFPHDPTPPTEESP